MFSFQRRNTPYMSIFPFDANKLASEPEPMLPLKTTTPNRRKPGSRKPRNITKYIEIKRTPVNNVSPDADNVTGFEHIFNKQKPVITPDSDRVIGISHLFK